jgi:uncharacterized protein involved in exopolysaccharide biosynthesis
MKEEVLKDEIDDERLVARIKARVAELDRERNRLTRKINRLSSKKQNLEELLLSVEVRQDALLSLLGSEEQTPETAEFHPPIMKDNEAAEEAGDIAVSSP